MTSSVPRLHRYPNVVVSTPRSPKTRGFGSHGEPTSSSVAANPDSLRIQDGSRSVERTVDDLIPLNDEDPELPPGRADASPSSSLFDSRAFEGDDEDLVDEVEQTKKAASTQKVKVCPDSPGSTLSKKESLQHLQEKCRISEDIELVVPSSVDRADAPPPGYLTLFENYFDQCLLWFPLTGFLMRFLAAHGVCLAQINPRVIRHLIGIYVLSRDCGVDISTEHLSYLTDLPLPALMQDNEIASALSHSPTNVVVGFSLLPTFMAKKQNKKPVEQAPMEEVELAMEEERYELLRTPPSNGLASDSENERVVSTVKKSKKTKKKKKDRSEKKEVAESFVDSATTKTKKRPLEESSSEVKEKRVKTEEKKRFERIL
ncbi:hypothetical protein AALP_AA6G219900 [Arabis alpina]|uniref:Uncharacterized protein n=1 Tax=Arabis alpina TaxID=50452 RepID=A0A087GQW3_ARAAL|nr:hypothetical protein AALP_AA6G219900 [Arabis alpina]